MQITSNDSSLFFSLKSGKNITFDLSKCYVCLGNGETKYKMSHGSFNIKETILNKHQLYCKNIQIFAGNEDAKIQLSTNDFSVKIELSISTQNDRLVIVPTQTYGKKVNRFWLEIPSTKDEAVYGGGETFTEFNLKGHKANVWVAEHINGKQITKKVIKLYLGAFNDSKKQDYEKYETYYAQPTFMSSQKYFCHCHTTEYVQFDFTNDNKHLIQINGLCKITFGFGDDYYQLMKNLTDLLGRQPELPDWVYDGAILGIQGGTQTVYDKLKTVEKHNTSVAGVWCQDWEGRRVTAVGKQLVWNWVWDKELYPDLDKKIWELKDKGIKFLGYINPFIAVEREQYKYASEKGYCVHDKDGKDYLVKITTFPTAMIDFTNPDAYDWYKSLIKDNMIGFGLDGWMADFGEYLPTDCVLYSGEDPKTVHNTWPQRWAKMNREAVEETDNLGNIMFFTRSGYTETVKYSTMMWLGDQHVDWSVDYGFYSVVAASLSLSICGFGLSHSDVGGYTTFGKMKRSQELMMRWTELNAFSPLMRTHEGLNPDLNIQFDSNDEVLAHFAKYSRIHKALKPYLKQAVKENSKCGMPVIRPLFFHYDEERCYNEKCEMLLGRDILVAPVLTKNTDKLEVYLPNDNWIHLFSGKEYTQGTHIIDCPIGEIPVFIRKDSDFVDSFMNLAKL